MLLEEPWASQGIKSQTWRWDEMYRTGRHLLPEVPISGGAQTEVSVSPAVHVTATAAVRVVIECLRGSDKRPLHAAGRRHVVKWRVHGTCAEIDEPASSRALRDELAGFVVGASSHRQNWQNSTDAKKQKARSVLLSGLMLIN